MVLGCQFPPKPCQSARCRSTRPASTFLSAPFHQRARLVGQGGARFEVPCPARDADLGMLGVCSPFDCSYSPSRHLGWSNCECVADRVEDIGLDDWVFIGGVVEDRLRERRELSEDGFLLPDVVSGGGTSLTLRSRFP